MTLNKQNVSVSLGLGIDTKADKKQLQGGLLQLDNAVLQKSGEVRKRPGYNKLGKDIVTGGNITSGLQLGSYNSELVLINRDSVYSYAAEPDKWAYKSPIAAASVETTPIVANSYEQSCVDAAYSNNVAVYAWEDSRGGVRASVIDSASGAVLIADYEVAPSAQRPRCVGIGDYIFVYYVDGTDLYSIRLDTQNPIAFSAPEELADDVHATIKHFDVCVLGSRMILAYVGTAGLLRLSYVLQANRVGALIDGVPAPMTVSSTSPDGALCVTAGESVAGQATFHATWFDTSVGIRSMAWYQDFGVYKAAITVSSDLTADVRNITAIAHTGSLEVYAEREAAAAINHYVERYALSVAANTVTVSEVWQRGVGLASKAYRVDGATKVMTSYASAESFQDTYFVLGSGLVQAKVLAGVAGGHTKKASQVPGAWSVGGSRYLVAGLRKARIVADNVSTFSLTGVDSVVVDYASARIGLPVQLGGNMHIPGGYLKIYDGVSVSEHGYHLYPESVVLAQAGAGSIADGTYLYSVVYEWIDARGQIHRSAPSVGESITVSSGPRAVEVTVPTLRITDKKAPGRSPVTVSVYRSVAGGTVLYKVSSDTSPLYNDTSVDTVVFTDTLADASITSRPLLYTTGGVVENSAVPSCNVVKEFKNRLFVAGLEQSGDVLYSKQYVRDEGVAFSDLFRLSVGTSGGGVTAFAAMDDKLIIFKARGIYMLTGEGPTDAGAQNDFLTPQLVSADVGCDEPESVVETPAGIMFKSAKGVYLLTRALVSEYIGAPVEDYNALNISGAVVVPDNNQVRLTTREGTTLVYDYFFNKWSTFSNQASVASVSWQSTFAFLRDDGSVWLDTPTEFSDAGTPIRTRIGTAWMSLGGIQGYQRIYRILLLGQYRGPHKLRVRVAYDFEEHFTEEFIVEPATTIQGEAYGVQSFGSGVFGEGSGVYQFSLSPARQKCSAMRLLIEDAFPDSVASAAFNLSAITLTVGIKGRTNPTAPSMSST